MPHRQRPWQQQQQRLDQAQCIPHAGNARKDVQAVFASVDMLTGRPSDARAMAALPR
ncbi:hypothetical protein HOE425_330503 [Hoeflea sp. EC-HK425]|nr:hypothetical protein HOE425_330503 [Hoeflea sp. EC-HK425]